MKKKENEKVSNHSTVIYTLQNRPISVSPFELRIALDIGKKLFFKTIRDTRGRFSLLRFPS